MDWTNIRHKLNRLWAVLTYTDGCPHEGVVLLRPNRRWWEPKGLFICRHCGDEV